ncbi:uncharacterized protein LOC100824822 [Brachypodium distachyon]|uniref:Uncharacterized protein n=1 Tax=Brachypodium distachyon TaxID=15368 RepID=I1I8I0_BRADI|nr:uncharacterized protein LOC100824822 [Brachypodium distachyon]KQJ98947.1 hypothetical protein BRADI_3g40147v3 [Brachypodium distachyon]KQJ98948.1 hypothetical protein BRADI_3g40147v3 [Brachypodium distachyon]|eukprot:XP_003574759.1 uncharacterized protein LOC100824822 [Brachypodium distachyon]
MAAAASSAAAGGGGRSSSRDIRLTVQEAAKKLALWHTATFRPILTHDDLEPILYAAGFVALPLAPPPPPPPAPETGTGTEDHQERPAVLWREYAFLGGGTGGGGGGGPRGNAVVGWTGPRPRLPYPRVDALHIRTYQAFLGAVEVYLGAARVPNLFHVRCMPVTTKQDRVFDKVFRAMRNDQEGIIVYRDGTLDETTFNAVCSEHTAIEEVGYHVIPGNASSEFDYVRHSKIHGNCDKESCKGCPGYIDVVLLKDLFPRPSRNVLV